MEFEEGFTSDDSILPEGSEPTPRTSSGELTCEVCGTPLVYAGTGRKPKRCPEHRGSRGGVSSAATGGGSGSRSGAGRGSASVEQAIATLGNLYDLLGMGFFLATPEAAALWSSNVADLQTRNRAILSGDPELTKSINRLGVKGGKFAFAAVQVSALTPPAMVAAQALRARADERTAQARREQMRRNSQGSGANSGSSATGTEGSSGPDLGRNRGFFE